MCKVPQYQVTLLITPPDYNYGAQHSEKFEINVGGITCQVAKQSTCKGSHTEDLRNRGVHSLVKAQACGIGKFVGGCVSWGARKVVHIMSTHIYDDASMWVQYPADPKKEFSNEFIKKLQKHSGPKGRNVHLTVLNNCETLYVQSLGNSKQAINYRGYQYRLFGISEW